MTTTSRNREQGLTLIGMVIAVGLLAITLVGLARLVMDYSNARDESAQAQSVSQFAVGLHGFIAAVQGGTVTLPSNPYTVSGVNWLKPPSCGGPGTNPVQGFIPCTFNAGAVGGNFSTTVTDTAATNSIVASTSFCADNATNGICVNYPAGSSKNHDLVLAAASVAKDALAYSPLPSGTFFYSVLSNSPPGSTTQAPVGPLANANAGRVQLIVSNAPSQDPWLRVDGTNQMLADLNMGGHSIKNAKNADFSGDLRVHGVAQIDGGLVVDNGAINADQGLSTPDAFFQGVGRYASEAIYNAEVYTGAGSYSIPKPVCTGADAGSIGGPGGSVPRIYTVIQDSGNPQGANAGNPDPDGRLVGPDGDALYSSYLNVSNAGGSWTVTPVVYGTTYWLSSQPMPGNKTAIILKKRVWQANPANVVFLAMTKCS